MNRLYTNISARGKDAETLLVLHGWGMNHTAWTTVRQSLEKNFQVIWVDLPGHGKSVDCPLGNLDEAVNTIFPIVKQTQKKVHILAWSLGGLIAQRLAEFFPEYVASLILVATTPSFVQRSSWDHALPEEVLLGFHENLTHHFKATLKRFFALQFMGVKGGQAAMKKLRNEVLAAPPNLQALQDGLDILCDTDLRLSNIACPRYWILGVLDKLVPVSVVESLEVIDGDHSIAMIEGAGHAPFISHPDVFLHHINQFFIKRKICGNL